eukprot:TRINITY_DN4722_c0_g1_i1.p2 TRINITY_DN4722_c0_g1~~TRINITY_DN4722_c0_g1_i1.p2  ORF type:complete len:164 (+),score=14.43 TRINITY_DN4722_c0_g1_i1:120-611(+)
MIQDFAPLENSHQNPSMVNESRTATVLHAEESIWVLRTGPQPAFVLSARMIQGFLGRSLDQSPKPTVQKPMNLYHRAATAVSRRTPTPTRWTVLPRTELVPSVGDSTLVQRMTRPLAFATVTQMIQDCAIHHLIRTGLFWINPVEVDAPSAFCCKESRNCRHT